LPAYDTTATQFLPAKPRQRDLSCPLCAFLWSVAPQNNNKSSHLSLAGVTLSAAVC